MLIPTFSRPLCSIRLIRLLYSRQSKDWCPTMTIKLVLVALLIFVTGSHGQDSNSTVTSPKVTRPWWYIPPPSEWKLPTLPPLLRIPPPSEWKLPTLPPLLTIPPPDKWNLPTIPPPSKWKLPTLPPLLTIPPPDKWNLPTIPPPSKWKLPTLPPLLTIPPPDKWNLPKIAPPSEWKFPTIPPIKDWKLPKIPPISEWGIPGLEKIFLPPQDSPATNSDTTIPHRQDHAHTAPPPTYHSTEYTGAGPPPGLTGRPTSYPTTEAINNDLIG